MPDLTPAIPAVETPADPASAFVINNVIHNNSAAPRPTASLKSVGASYALWVASWFGIAGLHRFYLGKPGTGILWLLTFGLFFIGTIVDAVTMPKQVREVNYRNGH